MAIPEIGESSEIDGRNLTSSVAEELPLLQPISEAQRVLGENALPETGAPLSPERVTLEVPKKADEIQRLAFPNLWLTTLQTGLAFEEAGIKRLESREGTVNDYLKNIDKLLDLNAKLAASSEKGKKLSEEIQAMLLDLKERGLHLWERGDFEANDQKLSELKSLISSHIDKSRTQVQIEFTKMNTILTEMNSVIDTMKAILRFLERLYQTLARNQTGKG